MAKRSEKTRAVTGDNEMSDDARFRVTNDHRKHYEKLLELKKEADDAVKEYRGTIKEDLGAKGLADIKDLIALSTPEGEAALKTEMERKARVLRWMNIPIGTQGALFGEPDRRPITERAFAEGRCAGLAGEPHNNRHHHTNEAHSAYNEGFAEGQSALATNGFKSIDGSDVSPSDAWMRQTREQNERRAQDAKSDAIDSLTQN